MLAPSGLHANCSTPSAASVILRASPPAIEITNTCPFFALSFPVSASVTNASLLSSGDHCGFPTPSRSNVSGCCAPVFTSIITSCVSCRSSFRFTREITAAMRVPSCEIAGFEIATIFAKSSIVIARFSCALAALQKNKLATLIPAPANARTLSLSLILNALSVILFDMKCRNVTGSRLQNAFVIGISKLDPHVVPEELLRLNLTVAFQDLAIWKMDCISAEGSHIVAIAVRQRLRCDENLRRPFDPFDRAYIGVLWFVAGPRMRQKFLYDLLSWLNSSQPASFNVVNENVEFSDSTAIAICLSKRLGVWRPQDFGGNVICKQLTSLTVDSYELLAAGDIALCRFVDNYLLKVIRRRNCPSLRGVWIPYGFGVGGEHTAGFIGF